MSDLSRDAVASIQKRSRESNWQELQGSVRSAQTGQNRRGHVPFAAHQMLVDFMSKQSNALSWLILSVLIIVADQISKGFVLEHFQLHESLPVIDGLLNWTLAYNEGAAFSFLSDAGGWQRWFFTALAVVVSSILVVWLSRTNRSDWRTALPLALIVGGAIGNVIDRIRLGHVVDFIDVHYGTWSWPAFNIADSAISVGAVMLIAFGMFASKPGSAR